MKLSKKGLFCRVVVLLIFSSACSLSSMLPGSGDDDTASPGDKGSTSSSGVDTTQVNGDVNPGLVRLDKKKFQAEDFGARSVPVEVTITGNVTPEVTFKAALEEPDYFDANASTEMLNIFVIMENHTPSIFGQDDDFGIYSTYWYNDWQVDLFDAQDNLLLTTQLGMNTLPANISKVYDFNIPKCPKNISRVAVTINFTKSINMGYDCAHAIGDQGCVTVDEMGFTWPDPIMYQTPVQISMKKAHANGGNTDIYAMADVDLTVKNPYNLEMPTKITLLFLDDTGALVGYFLDSPYLEANGTQDYYEYQSSFLAAIPTQVRVNYSVHLEDILKARNK